MPLSVEQAKGLRHGQTLYHLRHRNADGTPQRWRVNGKVKRWKRSPDRVEIPIKHGLWSYDYVTNSNLHLLTLDEDEADRTG